MCVSQSRLVWHLPDQPSRSKTYEWYIKELVKVHRGEFQLYKQCYIDISTWFLQYIVHFMLVDTNTESNKTSEVKVTYFNGYLITA